LPLHLQLLVLAFILSGAKDPEELTQPIPLHPFSPYSPLLSLPNHSRRPNQQQPPTPVNQINSQSTVSPQRIHYPHFPSSTIYTCD
jgi:hypothetical protein